MADIELDPDPTSTWGATPAYVEAWQKKYGRQEDPAPSGGEADEGESKRKG